MNSGLRNHWFACPRPNSRAGTRLFLFPYAGAGSAAFGKWTAEFPGEIEVHIAHYPGRGSRHNQVPLKSITSFAEFLSLAIQPLLDRHFAFFGHSFGGLVAFELTRQLGRQGLPGPQMLFVSACGAPHIPDPHPPIHTLPDQEFVAALQEFNGFPADLANVPELIDLLLPVLRADFEAAETYEYSPDGSPLHCPVVAMGGMDDPRMTSERLEGWSSHTNATFKARYFPGDHFFIHTDRTGVTAFLVGELASSYARD